MTRSKRILSGIQPSGSLHIGNYFGMMKPAIELQAENECFYFIADFHALTQLPAPQALRERVLHVALDFLACGLDPARTVFFRQSDVPEVTELTWVLCCLTPVGLLERCHSYKDKVARGIIPNHGLFTYPVLMAADILIYNSNLVPVGRDQKQHLEVTRDLAQRFNNQYGDILVMPDPMIRDEVAVVPGIDGQKMSKSYDNTIEIFGAEKEMRKKIMKIVTDSTPLEEPKDPDQCSVFALYKLFADSDELAAMRSRYEAGGMGYGHAKQALFEKYWEYFRPFRERRAELSTDLAEVERILQDGAERARAAAVLTLGRVKKAVGLS
jgi:tryptophanyl-tRNA synthetase